MLTSETAATLGYTFEVDPDENDLCTVTKDGAVVGIVRADCPLFFAIRFVAELVDDDLATADVTPELVQATSGETYAPPDLPPPVATSDDTASQTAAIVSANLAAAKIPPDALPAIFNDLLGQAEAAITYFERFALDPSMNSPQWTAFQALPQAEKDRLQYDSIRTLAAIMRLLSGHLVQEGGASVTAPVVGKRKTS